MIVLEHDISDAAQSVPAAQCPVREFYFRPDKGWTVPGFECNALVLTNIFFEFVDWGIEIDTLHFFYGPHPS